MIDSAANVEWEMSRAYAQNRALKVRERLAHLDQLDRLEFKLDTLLFVGFQLSWIEGCRQEEAQT